MNRDIKNKVKFSKDYQPSKESRIKAGKTKSANTIKKRELAELLQIALKGKFGIEINNVLKDSLNIEAKTIEEALHFIQISKAINDGDTQSYQAIMNTSGLNKPTKISDTDSNGKDKENENKEPKVIIIQDGKRVEI